MLAAALIVAGFAGWFVFFSGPHETSGADREAFCLGWPNGAALALVNTGQIDAGTAVAMAQSPSVPACDPSLATRGDSAEAWCEGFARAYVAVGVQVGFGEPPQGRDTLVAEMIPECVEIGVPFDPLVAGTGVASAGRNNG